MTYDSRGRGAYLAETRAGKDGSVTTMMRLCAEPPPDVSANIEAKSDLAGNLDAAAKYKAFEVALKGELTNSQSASSTIADAATRTELVLLMRDALYRVCEMHFNDVLDKDQARKAFEGVLATARNLGQRDNVGKLVDVVHVLASRTDGLDMVSQPLIVELLGTIRYLATSDHLLNSGLDDEVSRAAITAAFLEQVLGENRYGQAMDVVKLQLQMDFAAAKKEERAEEEKVEKAKEAVKAAKEEAKKAQEDVAAIRASFSEAKKAELREAAETAAKKLAEEEGRAAALEVEVAEERARANTLEAMIRKMDAVPAEEEGEE